MHTVKKIIRRRRCLVGRDLFSDGDGKVAIDAPACTKGDVDVEVVHSYLSPTTPNAGRNNFPGS